MNYSDRLAALRLLGIENGWAASHWSDADLLKALKRGLVYSPPEIFMGLPTHQTGVRGLNCIYATYSILPDTF